MSAFRDRDVRRSTLAPEGARDEARWIGEIWQRLGTNGDVLGMNGVSRETLRYCYAGGAAIAGAICAANIVTLCHNQPDRGWAVPVVLEVSSWFTLVTFLWVAWSAFRFAPLTVRPRWKHLVHLPAALLFSLAHVVGFVGLRTLAFRLGGSNYIFDFSVPQFMYEFSKDALGYALFISMCVIMDHLLRRRDTIAPPLLGATYDISDGARLTRVRLEQILAIQSAGNYVEFALDDGRKLLMRSSLSAIERDLGSRGFFRTHRSWLVNGGKLTGLKPEGWGDYTIELGAISVPLSRRFSRSLAKLRQGNGVVP